MNRAEMEAALEVIETEARAARDEMAMLRERLKLLTKTSDALRALLNPDAERPSPSASWTTGSLAEMILRGDPSRTWNPRQMHDEMIERGWAEPAKDGRAAVRVALSRLNKREERVTRTREQDGMTYAYQWVAESA